MKRIAVILVMLLLHMAFMMGTHQIAIFAQAQSNYEIEDDERAEDKEEEGLVSLDFKDADLKDVLKVFSQQSGLNFVASKTIEDKQITLYMNNVRVEDALKTLLEANNLGLHQSPESNILIVRGKPVSPIQTITRVYKVRYYHSSSSPGDYILKAGAKSKAQAPTGGWEPILRPLLSEYGSMVDHVNLLIITDLPDRFKLLDQVISEIDKPIPEVMIEVELIETTANFLKNLGAKWNKEMARYQGPARITPFPYTPWSSLKDNTIALTPLPEDGAMFQYGLLSSTAMSWILEMLESDTNTKFLAKPRILVQDREWAEIKVTANQVVSVVTTMKENGDTLTEVERMEVGTVLRIVPVINVDEGFVSMLLEPTLSRPVSSTFTDSQGTKFIDPHERSLRTVVMTRDGETVAVGGFITTEDEETRIKVPWLGDIPLLGAFFRHTSTTRVDKELLIFITPKIINPSERVEIWTQENMAQGPETRAAPQDKHKEIKPGQKEQEEFQELAKQETLEETKPSEIKADLALPKDLPFREQEELADMNIDLTVQSSNLGVVDLIK